MKKLTSLLLLVLSINLYSADLLVEEFSAPPSFNSIQDAIDAANDGDRIFIKNRAGDIPYIEDLTVTKSLEFLSYDNDTQWIMQGNITVQHSSPGKEFTFVGMKNIVGSLFDTATSSSGRSYINIIDCSFDNGVVLSDSNTMRLNIVHTDIHDGYIRLRYGDIIGCELDEAYIQYDNPGTSIVDTFQVVGNIITLDQSGSPLIGLNIDSDAGNMEVRNNYISAQRCIYVTETNFNTRLNIYNNTLRVENTSSSATGIWLTGSSVQGIIEMLNNVIVISDGTVNTVYGIRTVSLSGTAQTNAFYNHIDSEISNGFSGSFTANFQNTINEDITININGELVGPSSAIDGANPGPIFYDLDLSPGDAGAYGGSFTLDNFHPLHTGSSRVYMVRYPFNVRQGETLDIEADSYDR